MTMSHFRARVFELEEQAIRTREAVNLARYAAIESELNSLALSSEIYVAGAQLAKRAMNARLNERTMATLDAAYEHLQSSQQRIDDAAIEAARAFVSELVGIDLSSIRVIRCAGVGMEEASARACGTRDHVIFLPPTGFKSVDLLVHEFGHAAEFLVRRSTDEDSMLVSQRPASEAVAYFCQFSYLLEHGSTGARQLALAAFLPCYLAIQFLYATNRSGAGDLTKILAHARFAAFRRVYPSAALRGYVEPLEREAPLVIMQQRIDPLLGIPIALNMIRYRVSAIELMRLSAQLPLDEALRKQKLDPQSLLDFSDLSQLFFSFFDGELLEDRVSFERAQGGPPRRHG